jgi:hypothetical protein
LGRIGALVAETALFVDICCGSFGLWLRVDTNPSALLCISGENGSAKLPAKVE